MKPSFPHRKNNVSQKLLGEKCLEGVVDRITYRNEENLYTVLRLEYQHGNQKSTTPVTGYFPNIQVGETVRLEGQWVQHPQYGAQFEATSHETLFPHTINGIEKYLGSGLIKGIGEVYAKRIVEHFKLDTLQVIDTDIKRLREVDGIGDKRLEAIRAGWDEHRAIKDIMVYLASHNISVNLALRIYKVYGKRSAEIVRHHPYQLVHDIAGVGFISADRIARDIGIEPESRERIEAGIYHTLSEAQDSGHCYVPAAALLEQAEALLKVDSALIRQALEALKTSNRVIEEDERYFLYRLHRAETAVAEGVARCIKRAGPPEPPDRAAALLNALEQKIGITYDPSQRDAILTAAGAGVCVMTGGPGTGKTTTVRGIIGFLEQNRRRYLLAAPTGRAAKRLEEATGREAKTIHRLLEFDPRSGGFNRNAHTPLQADVVIVDEASMIDILLFQSLMEGIPHGCRLVLVGDIDQLPSVGPGNVLRDLIDSEQVAVVRLSTVYRQGDESDIVSAAHQVNRGEAPRLGSGDRDTIFFIQEEDPARMQQTIRDLCISRLPKRYGFDPVQDIQVLTPMHKGEVGAQLLNQMLQRELNPSGREFNVGDRSFRSGDKVMQVRNNYDKEVYNGDVGRIRRILVEEGALEVDFDGRLVRYLSKELDELTLGYAMTVHKSQGSEYRAVIMPLTTQHYVLLQRNLLYTAMTRARELLVMVGTKKALYIAVRNNQVGERFTALAERIRMHAS